MVAPWGFCETAGTVLGVDFRLLFELGFQGTFFPNKA
jgi:hypothetical protein